MEDRVILQGLATGDFSLLAKTLLHAIPENLLHIILIFAVSFWVALFILPKLSDAALSMGLLDQPNKRKVHSCPKPLVGGIGMIMAVAFSSLLFIPPAHLIGVYAGIMLLGIVGFMDDFRELNHRWKFIAQICATVLIIYFGRNILKSFGDILPYGTIDLGILSLPLTLFCSIGVMNAMNMIDGLDGLAGGISLIALASFALLAYVNNQWDIMLFSIAFSGAVIAFLKYNWRARLFMGDAGSLTIGFTLAFLSIAITQTDQSLVPPIAPLLLLAVPIVDAVTTMMNRLMRRKSPFHADRTHFHHILLRFGFNQKRAVKIILGISCFLSAIALTGTIFRIPEYLLFLVFLSYCILAVFLSHSVNELYKIKVQFKRRGKVSRKGDIRTKIGQILDHITKIKRRYARYLLSLPVACYWRKGGKAFSSTTVHLGLGGFSTVLPHSLLEGEKLTIDLYLGGDNKHQVSADAEVVWSQVVHNGFLHGLKFTDIHKKHSSTLEWFLKGIAFGVAA
jgi:UDP-GlcNAc:undecaprenyl-phosphate/decaprenyl-phosphate GlcNAc-1-phosphate transferase